MYIIDIEHQDFLRALEASRCTLIPTLGLMSEYPTCSVCVCVCSHTHTHTAHTHESRTHTQHIRLDPLFKMRRRFLTLAQTNPFLRHAGFKRRCLLQPNAGGRERAHTGTHTHTHTPTHTHTRIRTYTNTSTVTRTCKIYLSRTHSYTRPVTYTNTQYMNTQCTNTHFCGIKIENNVLGMVIVTCFCNGVRSGCDTNCL